MGEIEAAMDGFDEKWSDPPDYILGVTYEIWEQRQVDTLEHYYAPDIPVRSPAGVVIGNRAVIEATHVTLHEFPDRQLFGEDVIWSVDPDGGFLSSHRIMSTATHAADGVYGSATGRRLRYRIIADCAVRENQIYDEWLIRDQGAIVRQLGFEPKRFAADQIRREGGFDGSAAPFGPATDVVGRYRGTGNRNEAGERYESLLRAVMSGEMASIEQTYDRGAHLELPGGATGHSWVDAVRFWSELRSAFPTATFRIHHVVGRDDAGQPPRAAVRWSLEGEHDGPGRFGDPTGAHVYVMGISHAEFGPRGLHREWVLIDDTAIWKQILLHTG